MKSASINSPFEFSMNKSFDTARELIKWSTVALLLGKGVLHFTSDQKYHILFSNSEMISSIFGGILIFFSCLLIVKSSSKRPYNGIMCFVIPSAILAVQSYCSYVSAGYLLEQMIEHSLQIGLPCLYILSHNTSVESRLFQQAFCKSIIALTFIGHGMYAIGYHIVPDHFITMTQSIFGWNQTVCEQFLMVMGYLDFLFAGLLFVPQLNVVSLSYMVVWGSLTALARMYPILSGDFTLELLTVYLPNTIYRLGHGLVPFVLFIIPQTRFKTTIAN